MAAAFVWQTVGRQIPLITTEKTCQLPGCCEGNVLTRDVTGIRPDEIAVENTACYVLKVSPGRCEDVRWVEISQKITLRI